MSERNQIIDELINKLGEDFEKDILQACEGRGDEFIEGMSIGIGTAADKLADMRE